MQYKVLSKEDISETFIAMDELQDHLRLYDPHEEALIAVYRLAAIDFAERYMNRAIGLQEVSGFIGDYRSRVQLPYGDVDSVTAISCVDNEDLISIPETDYRLNPVTNEVMINSKYSKCSEFVINFKAGYQAENVPAAIKVGCMKLISTWYENREDVSNGTIAVTVPFNHRACFDLYRIPAGA
ncbi:head-tail connector protein [Aeromonas veronii]|uniref:head-tail connector protein n=1 Tax=Aeromonas veronii TaxID=654 RepID=UPI003D1FFBBB